MTIDFSEKQELFPKGSKVLCAVSGGKDSMYLLENMRKLAPMRELSIACGHFNHRLRGDASEGDQRFVEDYCKKLDIPCYVGEANVAAFAAENSLGIEEAARLLRYEFLEKTADEIGATQIATAHTGDDNVETLIMNLARGCGLKGLCGIPEVRGRLVRPMLEVSTQSVLEYLRVNAIPYVEDASNAEDIYTRNKIRHKIIPLLREINGSFDENAARCISLISEDEEYLWELARMFVEENFSINSLPAAEFSKLPPPISARVLRVVVPRGLSQEHIRAVRQISAAADPHGSVSVPGMGVFRDYDRLVFDGNPGAEIAKRGLVAEGITNIPEAGLQIVHKYLENYSEIHNSFMIFCFNRDSICGNIFITARLPGDEIRLLGRGCTKSLKKLFSDAKLNGENKGLIPVLRDEKGVIAVFGLGIAERCAPKIGHKVIELEFKTMDQ